MDMIKKPARTRFAPSPTGRLHLGGARTALYDYLLARQTGGQFILRLEDTDSKRFVPGAEEELMQGLRWMGIEWDEGPDVGGLYAPYRQSERKEIYQEYAQRLIANDQAFYCFCTPEKLERVREKQRKFKLPQHYDGTCRKLDPAEAAQRALNGEPHVIRFKTPKEGEIVIRDHLRGEIVVENKNLDDYILVKSDGLALYHLAAMVDDHLMGITHVIRGSEWLSTFPLHVHIVRALKWEEPVWVHLSVFLKPSGKGKMSKRESADLIKDGYSIFVSDMANLGYLPEALVNWISLMGWSYDGHTEFFCMPDLIEKFSLDHLNPSPAAINFTKLDHFNGLHIRQLTLDELARRVKPYFIKAGYQVDDEKLARVVKVIRERIPTLEDAPEMGGLFFLDHVKPDPQELIGKNMTAMESKAVLQRSYDLLLNMPEINPAIAEEPMRQLAQEMGLSAGQFFGILRVAVTGRTVSPPLFESMEIIGKGTVLERIRTAQGMLDGI